MNQGAHRVAGSYRVNFSPEAWKLIGLMSSATFQSLQGLLERIAASPRRPAGEQPSPQQATLGTMTIVYEVDDAERIVTVLGILRTDVSPN